MNAQELIPQWWSLKVETIEDVTFLGKATVDEIIAYWEREYSDSYTEKKLPKLLKLIKGGKEKILKQAQKFENPDFPNNYIDEGSWAKRLEPGDAASINRKKGATTFNVCGWCEWAGGCVCRYNYAIDGHCFFYSLAGLESEEFAFNTPCFIATADEEAYASIEKGLVNAMQENAIAKRLVGEKIELLKSLKPELKPALAAYRPYDWFDINDPVICYVDGWKDRIVSDLWATAKVINGYRHQDGCVSVSFDQKLHNGEYLNGHGSGFGMSRPEIMHLWEFEYLRTHLDFAKIYASEKTKEFNAELFLAALEVENGTSA